MLKTSSSENVLPLCQSIRSPHYEAADERMAKFHRNKQTKMILLGLVAAASTVGVIGKTTSLMQPEYALRRRLLQTSGNHNVDDEPSMFTPRIVLDAMSESERIELQQEQRRLQLSSPNEEAPPAA